MTLPDERWLSRYHGRAFHVPQRNDEPARLEEGDVVSLIVHAAVEVPAERLVERLGPRDIADAESTRLSR